MLTGLSAAPEALPEVFALHGAVPNPFNPCTELRFDLPEAARVTLAVYDLAGRRVRTLAGGQMMPAGPQALDWDGRDDGGRAVSAGTYFYRLEAGRFAETRTMTLVK